MGDYLKCEICGIRRATRQDYRQMDGVTSKRLVCDPCFRTSDESIRKIMDERRTLEDFSNEELVAEYNAEFDEWKESVESGYNGPGFDLPFFEEVVRELTRREG